MLTMISVSGVNELLAKLPALVRREFVIDPASYRDLASGYDGANSENWDEVAYAADLVALHDGNPTTHPASKLLEFGLGKAAVRDFGEREFGSWIYTHHTFNPKLIQMGVANALVGRDAAWSKVSAGQYEYLRAWVGWLAATGCWGPARDLSAAEKGKPIGAQVLRSRPTDKPIEYLQGAHYSVLTGKRSWHKDEFGWSGPFHLGPVILEQFGFGTRLTGRGLFDNSIISCLRWRGWIWALFSPDEQNTIKAATQNNRDALEWVVRRLIRDYIPLYPTDTFRTTRGVSFTVLESDHSSTATTDHCSWLDTGEVWFCGHDPGLRATKDNPRRVQPGRADLDHHERTGVCYRTTTEEPVVRVPFEMVPGDEVWHMRTTKAGGAVTVGEAAPVPTPQPPIPPKKENRWTDWL